jgi:hypothetical protein
MWQRTEGNGKTWLWPYVPLGMKKIGQGRDGRQSRNFVLLIIVFEIVQMYILETKRFF